MPGFGPAFPTFRGTSMAIKVIAHRAGYYGHYREPGDEFEVADEKAFHDSWMERADGKQGKRVVGNAQQTTGNNPLGAKPQSRSDTLPQNDLT